MRGIRSRERLVEDLRYAAYRRAPIPVIVAGLLAEIEREGAAARPLLILAGRPVSLSTDAP
jgi:hypothetical protein